MCICARNKSEIGKFNVGTFKGVGEHQWYFNWFVTKLGYQVWLAPKIFLTTNNIEL